MNHKGLTVVATYCSRAQRGTERVIKLKCYRDLSASVDGQLGEGQNNLAGFLWGEQNMLSLPFL